VSRLSRPWQAVFGGLILLAGFLVLNQLFNWQLFIGLVILENRHLYAVGGCLISLVFLAYPATGRAGDHLRWYDVLPFAVTLGATAYLVWNGERAVTEGWEYGAPGMVAALCGLYWLAILEATRRAGGLLLAVVVLFFSLYPVVADRVPGPIQGFPRSLPDTLVFHIVSAESAFGIPMRAFVELVIGFIVFGVALSYTGGGKFFNDIAFALVGGIRGGPAQVGILSSGLQGSISGSVISNVITSGVVTIPAMKRCGFTATYAGAVEATSSTGAVLMPPVMGSTAFIMASFLGLPYGEIALAATIPGLLFYFGLAMQVDAYAARQGIRGLPREELPSVRLALREGAVYLLAFAVLIGLLVGMDQEALAPIYATAALLVINQLSPRTRLTPRGWLEFVEACGRALAELAAILAGCGLIIGAFSMTGLAGTLANDLVFLAGDAPLVLLVMGALTSFIFGLGMTVTACYIFLAIVLAPALVKAGLDALAVHLFIMYWGMVSFITPPVALAAFAAATLAGASPMRVGLESMRMGSVMYFLPFMFVLNPALILRGSMAEIVLETTTAAAGVVVVAAALQGYLIGVGRLGGGGTGWFVRMTLLASGVALAMPGNGRLYFSDGQLAVIAAALAVPTALVAVARRRPPRPSARLGGLIMEDQDAHR
jgi:TRAP transporter 4TM/12TM fusion protein